MRLIGTLDNERDATVFSGFLSQMGIPNRCEAAPNFDWGSSHYGDVAYKIWIEDEDQVDTALEWLSSFKQNPKDTFYTKSLGSSQAQQKPGSNRAKVIFNSFGFPKRKVQAPVQTPITKYIILLCVFLFFWKNLTAPEVHQVPPNIPYVAVSASPIEKSMLYDYPKAYTLADKLYLLYGPEKLVTPSTLPKEGAALYQLYSNTPYWKGFYGIAVNALTKRPYEDQLSAPLFEKIKEGEVWRLLTPALLHYDIFHIFFNMIWLLILGRQIERHLGKGRYLILMALIGIFSNTAQYLMGGANFLGYSGILCGMIAFIWARQRYAVWEGYQLDRSSIVFLGIFVLTMFGIQVLSFLTEIFFHTSIAPGIANTAHLSGAAMGLLLGHLKVFSLKKNRV